MLSVRERGILIYIIKHCKRIEEKINCVSREMIMKDKDIEEVICFNILQIGELAKGLTDDFISKYNKVPWKKIKGMRDKIAHGYGTIDLDEIWETASNDIVSLREYCEDIISNN